MMDDERDDVVEPRNSAASARSTEIVCRRQPAAPLCGAGAGGAMVAGLSESGGGSAWRSHRRIRRVDAGRWFGAGWSAGLRLADRHHVAEAARQLNFTKSNCHG